MDETNMYLNNKSIVFRNCSGCYDMLKMSFQFLFLQQSKKGQVLDFIEPGLIYF